jgi:DNA-binding transcriptional regulator/RsmH inhibitor MraZ
MITFIGDYTVRLDPKGRLSFPAAFKKQIKDGAGNGFVLKRDVFDKLPLLSVIVTILGFSIVVDCIHQNEINKIHDVLQ